MAQAAPSPLAAADGALGGRTAWSRPSESRFVWSAPSLSPTEVADLELRFPEIVQVPAEALADEASRWELNAILARSINRWVPPDAIIRKLQRGGVPGEVEAICLAHRCFILRFSDINAKLMVLGRLWVVNGQPIATEEWSAEFVPAEDSVPRALLWIRLPLLPMEFWTDEILRTIVSPAEEFLFSDPSTKAKNRGGFARLCVRVDLSKPLRPGARVRGRRDPFWQ